jgi:predicted metal-dependent peptidase
LLQGIYNLATGSWMQSGDQYGVTDMLMQAFGYAANRISPIVAKLAGKIPAGVTRSLEQSQATGVDWRELLRRAWSETIPSDYSWMPPNRRHIWAGLYLPGVRPEGAGEIAIAVDCSGSINAR